MSTFHSKKVIKHLQAKNIAKLKESLETGLFLRMERKVASVKSKIAGSYLTTEQK